MIEKKEIYFLKKLDDIPYKDHIYGNWIKKFWLRGEKPEGQINDTDNKMNGTLDIKKITEDCTNRIRRNQPEIEEDRNGTKIE